MKSYEITHLITFPVKILFFDKKGNGCWWYRTWLPAEALRQRGHEVSYAESLQEADLERTRYDIVVVSRMLEGDLYSVTQYLKWVGTRIVYDTDDGLDVIPAINPVYPKAAQGRTSMEFFLHEADLVTVTTERLANHVAERRNGKPVLVIPNCVDPQTSPVRMRQGKSLRVGYAGSVTHLADVIPFLDAVIEIQDRIEFTTVLFGFTKEHDDGIAFCDYMISQYEKSNLGRGEICRTLRVFRDRLSRIRNLEWQKAVPLAEYRGKLAELDLDLGVCPLEDTRFNSLKSDCKLLEYAMAGTTCVTADVPPYSDTLRPEWRTKKWTPALLKVLGDKTLQEKMHQDQLQWIMENRLPSMYAEEVEKAYLSLI